MLFLVVLLITLVVVVPNPAWSVNLVKNGGFEEGVESGGVPDSWTTYFDFGSPEYAVVDGGRSPAGGTAKCASISLTKESKAMLVSRRIPAVPGEKMRVGVWVRGKGFKARNSEGVIFTVACINDQGRFYQWFRFPKSEAGENWEYLSEEFETGPETAFVALEIGMNNAQGTVFFDDASVTAASPFAIRSDITGELELDESDVAFTLINREQVKKPVKLSVSIGDRVVIKEIQLSGDEEQQVTASVRSKPGKRRFGARLEDSSGKVLAELPERAITVVGGVELEPLVPTHFCIEDGVPTVEGRLWVHAPADELKDSTIHAVLRDSKGKVPASNDISDIKPGRVDFKLKVPEAGIGDYEVSVELTTADGSKSSDSQDWHIIKRSDSKIVFNSAGYPIVDGKPFFPLGTFNSGRYELMKQIGFNTVHAWNRIRTGTGKRPRHQQTKDFLDDAQKAGLKAVIMAPHQLVEQGNWDEVARRVRMFRNHPAILAWDEEEEVARGQMKFEDLKKLVEIVRKEDPNHPFCLADTYDDIRKIERARFFPADLMDVGMWWWYPIPLDPSGATAILEGQDPSKGTSIEPPTLLTAPNHDKPLWLGLQAYKKPKNPNGRLPSTQEYRMMAYLAVVHGAKGALYYMGGNSNQVEGETDPKRPWGYLNDLVPELAQMIPAFLAPSAKTQAAVEPVDLPISSAVKDLGSSRVMIAVNREAHPVDAVFKIDGIDGRKVIVRFEDREITPVNGKIMDNFEPYGVHIYEIR